MARKIDQVTLSIMVNNLYWTAEEMNEYLCQAAFSTNIKVRRDCSCAIYTRDGDMLAQGEFIPVHLGTMSRTLKSVLAVYPAETMKEGDVYLHNDPYQMGSHLWDVMMFRPVFVEKTLVAFVGNLAHHVDIGGAPVYYGLESIFEEGLRIPPVKLYREGVLDENVMRIFLNNVRTPYEAKGDLAAQTAANYRGEMRIKEMAEKYGIDFVLDYFQAILDYSEKGMRAAIAAVPDGEAEWEDYLEHDGIEEKLNNIKVKIVVKGEELFFDFAGTGPANAGPYNSPWSLTHAAVYYAVKAVLGSNIPTNQGAYRPIKLIRHEEESLVDARFPRPINMCTSNPVQRIADTCIGAFSKLVPDRVCACDGNWLPSRFVGMDERTGRYSSFVETYGAGRGAKHNEDGADAHQTHMTNTSNAPVEIMELEHPLKVLQYGMVPDSGGAGKFRGGIAIQKEIEVLSDMAVTACSMRIHIKPYGLEGGLGGATDFCGIYMPDGEVLTSCKSVPKGTKVMIRTSGGGGWGNPAEREVKRVEKDVLEGYISLEKAKELYKVVIDPQTMQADIIATQMLRREGKEG